jgi:hypothetical protein
LIPSLSPLLGFALSLMPEINGNMFAASLRTDICPQRKESSSTSHARNPFNLNFFDSAQCLMVRRWRLIGYFPILYNPCCVVSQVRLDGALFFRNNPVLAPLLPVTFSRLQASLYSQYEQHT